MPVTYTLCTYNETTFNCNKTFRFTSYATYCTIRFKPLKKIQLRYKWLTSENIRQFKRSANDVMIRIVPLTPTTRVSSILYVQRTRVYVV